MSTMSSNPATPEKAPPEDLPAAIDELRRQMNAVILAHYYQEDEIQDIADFIGDSLELSRQAASTKADIIVFCGVRFMAEVAKILNPRKKVLLPDSNASCSLEISCPSEAFRKFRMTHPNYVAISYINCSAEVKAASDIICTSSNAELIIRKIPERTPILFAPDKYLGKYLEQRTGRKMTLWEGTCVVHERFSERQLVKLRTQYPNAHIVAHPECPEALLNYAHFIGSTSKLLQYAEERPGEVFLVLTEPGIIHQMKKCSPDSHFLTVGTTEQGACVSCNYCPYMKLNTMEKLFLCMRDQAPELELPEDLRLRAKIPLDRMLEMSQTIQAHR